MRVSIIVAAVALAATLLLGQEKPADSKSESFEAVIIPVKTLSGDSFNRLAKLLAVFNVRYAADDKLRTIIVYAPKDVVAQMRRVVEQLDQPGSEAAIGRNIELTLAFLLCSAKPAAESRPLPADLEPVARQLKAATQYKDVQLWDSVPLHLQEGKETQQSLRLSATVPNVEGAPANTAQLYIFPETVSHKDSGRYVRFAKIDIGFHIWFPSDHKNPGQVMDLRLNTAGDFKEGQKTVLGKLSGIEEGSDVFVVISLKVLD